MKRHFLYGVEAPELGWVPAPRYLLRRDRVLRHVGDGNGRTVLDIGCGAGALLADLADRNFNCIGLDSSTHAAQVARAINSGNRNVSIVTEPDDSWQKKFDILLALEVLEHISDDQKAVETWLRWLKPGGLFVVSVPSHMRKWSLSDEWAGHVRRYEREDVVRLLSLKRLSVEQFENYGYPFMSAIGLLRKRYYAAATRGRKQIDDTACLSDSTAESGIDRSGLRTLYQICKSPPGLAMMMAAFHLQRLFLSLDLGDGYLVVARGE